MRRFVRYAQQATVLPLDATILALLGARVTIAVVWAMIEDALPKEHEPEDRVFG